MLSQEVYSHDPALEWANKRPVQVDSRPCIGRRAECSDSRRATGMRLSEKPPGFLDLDKASRFTLPPRGAERVHTMRPTQARGSRSGLGGGAGRGAGIGRTGAGLATCQASIAMHDLDWEAAIGAAFDFFCLLLPSNWSIKHSKSVRLTCKTISWRPRPSTVPVAPQLLHQLDCR